MQRKGDVAELFSAALETTPTRALRNRKPWAAHAKNILIQYVLPKEHCLCLLRLIGQKVDTQKFEVKQK